ncbi:UPF0686 protein C11orf1 homolog [Triplophysa rosa]|uniref:UPF0686 protein C11orf1-like protein n=1 Tax=Triplophysa rosa TaxID=992332 RepID=A0A9W7X2H4_TRIRA|nr:UPF0686 protein C11orf1 homolog [Triplophysa rosa]KAI7812570.1 putative UPF0686 protein C11orf1-like protein [Triplophysa rosa]
MSNKSNEFSRIQSSRPFHHMLRASGQSEVWYDFTDEEKFRRYGWRCSTNEDLYSNVTLIGNWNEERFDTHRNVALRRPLPHQFSHYFETTYSSSYNKDDRQPIYKTPKKESRSFHQPELDPPHMKCVPNSSYRMDFKEPPQNVETSVLRKSGFIFSH